MVNETKNNFKMKERMKMLESQDLVKSRNRVHSILQKPIEKISALDIKILVSFFRNMKFSYWEDEKLKVEKRLEYEIKKLKKLINQFSDAQIDSKYSNMLQQKLATCQLILHIINKKIIVYALLTKEAANGIKEQLGCNITCLESKVNSTRKMRAYAIRYC